MRHPLFICILFLLASLTFCKSKSNSQHAAAESPNNYQKDLAISIASTFAMNFKPDSFPYQEIGNVGKVPDSVVKAFKTLRAADTAAHDKWLALIFLKLYLDHLRCCYQGYELRTNSVNGVDSIADPLLYDFLISTKLVDVTQRTEFINSGIADSWITENPSSLNDPEIKNIMVQIKPVQDSIANGLYW